MSAELTNEEIREKLLVLNYDCGPVTDTTREVHLKKLNKLVKGRGEHLSMSDDELRSRLRSYGETVAPITSVNRHIYLKRLGTLSAKSQKANGSAERQDRTFDDEPYECEPMEID